jgi:hypothetical protein
MQVRTRPDKKIVTYAKHNKLAEKNRFYKKKTSEVMLNLIKRILLCTSEFDVDAAVALARALSKTGINSNNYLLILLFLETNNSYVVKALVGRRNPILLFSSIKPNWFLVKQTFHLLARFSHEEIQDKVLMALLGIVQNTYKTSKYGYSVYPLSIADVYNIGKYLDKKKQQDAANNRLILDMLYDIYQMGIDSDDRRSKAVAISANLIRMAYFDDTKRMTDAIPNVLLLSDLRGKEVNPKYIVQTEGGEGE